MPLLFWTVTLAFAIVAPDGSLIKPEILPRSDCPNRISEVPRLMNSSKRLMRHAIFMLSSVTRNHQATFSIQTYSQSITGQHSHREPACQLGFACVFCM